MDVQHLLEVEGCSRCIQISTCILYSNLVVIDVVNHCYNFISFELHCLGLICVPKSKVFLVKILHSSNFDIYHVFVLYVKGTNSQVECNQKSLAPTWQLVQLDVFDRPKVHQTMLEMEEETKYGLGGEVIANGVTIGDNIVVPCESRNGE